MQAMRETRQENEPASATLCKACGLCCTGHLFVNAEFKPVEVKTTKALGLKVLETDPEKPVFRLPCPLWDGKCTIYTHPYKPSICSAFKCKLLKEIEEEQVQLNEALTFVQAAKQLIQNLEEKLPGDQEINFRQRLFDHMNQLENSASHTQAVNAFRLEAGTLLVLFTKRFGVTGLFNTPEQAGSEKV